MTHKSVGPEMLQPGGGTARSRGKAEMGEQVIGTMMAALS